jgi:hypothetical protein
MRVVSAFRRPRAHPNGMFTRQGSFPFHDQESSTKAPDLLRAGRLNHQSHTLDRRRDRKKPRLWKCTSVFFPVYAKGIELYCALTVDDRDSWAPTVTHIALEGRCFILSACQVLRGRRGDFLCLRFRPV